MRAIILGTILIVGCSDRSSQKDTNSNRELRNANVSGFVECQGRRLDLVDGLIDFGTEPLEWEKYSQNSLNDLEFAEGESKFKSPKNLIWASGFLIGGPPSPGSETIR
jgi:hypothetical protein